MTDNIYVMEAGNKVKIVKIGISFDPEARLRQLQSVLPFELRLMHFEEANPARAIEMRVHIILRNTNIRGEWFRNTATEAVDIVRRVLEDPRYGSEKDDEPEKDDEVEKLLKKLAWKKEPRQ